MATISYSGATSSSVTVNFAHNGNVVDNYKTYRDGSLDSSGSFGLSSYHSFSKTFSGLSSSTSYYFSVNYYKGTTLVGNAGAYYSTLAPPPPPVPSGLSGLYVSVSGYAPNAVVTASWNYSSGANGYSWSYSGYGSDNGNVTGTSKTVYISSAGQYSFYVYPYNNSGSGQGQSYTFYVSNPPTPGYISLNANPIVVSDGNVGIRMSWSIPSNTTYVKVQCAGYVNNLDTSITSRDYTNLSEGQQYAVSVTPYNGNYAGSTVTQYVTTYARPTGAPTGVSVTPSNNKTFVVSWNQLSTATAGYVVYANDNAGSGDYYKVTTSSASATSATISLDKEWCLYTIKVKPKNSVGIGNSAGSVDYRTPDVTIPANSGNLKYGEVTEDTADVYVSGALDRESGVWGYLFYIALGANNPNVLNTTPYKVYSEPAGYKFTGLQQNKQYTIAAVAFDYGNNKATNASTINITTLQSIPKVVQAVGRFDNGFDLQWGAVNGATDYQLNYKPSVNSNWVQLTTTGTTYHAVLSEYGMLYDFRVRVSMDNQSSWNPWSATTQATTNPKPPILAGDYDGTTATLYVNGMNGTTFDAVIIERKLSAGDTLVDYKSVATNGDYVQWSIPSTEVGKYYFRAYSRLATTGGTTLYSLAYSGRVEFLRPLSFNWTGGDKVQGKTMTITAADWNAFTKRINEFRAYKGLSGASFTAVSAGTSVSAAIFNQAVNAINAMNSPIPAYLVTSQITRISAEVVNRVKNALNSIA